MRILVTGGAGFIGSNFVRRVFDGTLRDIQSVVVLDKLTYAGELKNLGSVSNQTNYEFIQGDICDVGLVGQLVDSVDAVINFAAESHVDRSILSAADFVTTNMAGVQVLLDVVKTTGKKNKFKPTRKRLQERNRRRKNTSQIINH